VIIDEQHAPAVLCSGQRRTDACGTTADHAQVDIQELLP
jgi:hypothetical protein